MSVYGKGCMKTRRLNQSPFPREYGMKGSGLSVSLTNPSELPDEINISMGSESSTVTMSFGTTRYDSEGAMALAVLRFGTEYYYEVTDANGKFLRYEGSTSLTESGSGTEIWTLQVYPAYTSYTSEDMTVELADGTKYYIIDGSAHGTINSTESAASFLPVGTIAWDLSNTTYDWDGGTVEIGFTYQWGYAEAVYKTVEVEVAGAKVIPTNLNNVGINYNAEENAYIYDIDYSAYVSLMDDIDGMLLNNSLAIKAVDDSAVPEEVGAGGDIEEVAVTVDRVQDSGVGHSGGPGGKDVSAVAPDEGVVSLGHCETLVEGADLFRHPGELAVNFGMGLHQRSPGGVRIATVVKVAERPAAAVGAALRNPEKTATGVRAGQG